MELLELLPKFEDTEVKRRFADIIARSEFDVDLIPAAEAAMGWYTTELPYHNLGHMFVVTETTLDLCETRSIRGVARQALVMAALWHDAAYPMPLESYEISKEHRSAQLAIEAIMSTAELTRETQLFADWVASLIISTHAEHVPTDEYEQILNEADIANLSGPLPEMFQNSVNFFIETCLLAGEELTGDVETILTSRLDKFTAWCGTTQSVLAHLVQNKVLDQVRRVAIFDRVQQVSPKNIFSELNMRHKTETD